MSKKLNLDIIVLIISILCLIWIFFYKVYFIESPELFKSANEIGEITYNIFSSIIASGVFYFFVVYLDKKRKEKIINKIVSNRLGAIGTSLDIIKQHTFPLIGLDPNKEIPDDVNSFLEKCKAGIKLDSTAPNIPNTHERPINWYQYFDTMFGSDQYVSNLLYKHITYLDIELIELLEEIQYSRFQRGLDSFRENGYSDDISGVAGPFWMYLRSLENISKYQQKKKTKNSFLESLKKRFKGLKEKRSKS